MSAIRPVLVLFALVGGCDSAGDRETVDTEAATAETAAPEPDTAAPEPDTAAPEPETAAPEEGTAAPDTAGPDPTKATASPGTGTPTNRIAKATQTPRRRPIIVYEAEWCQPCHALSAHLTRRGVRHVRKDIDKTPGALEEMNAKTASAGRPGAQLPVTDFRGRIIFGYEPAVIDRLCDEDAAARSGG